MHAKPEYVLGTHDEELVRLGFQHRVWAEQAFALWERAGFSPGQTVLDVGCGPGYATGDLSAIVGSTGRIIAVDESERFLEHLRREQAARGLHNIETILADVQRLELPEGSCDGAFARWVLCFVKEPEAVVAAVAKTLRRGGTFAVMDYYNYLAFCLAPRSDAFTRVIQAVYESWKFHGGDPEICTRLPGMMLRSGLTVREIRPVSRVGRPGSTLWNWPTTFFRNFLPKLVDGGFLTAQERRAFEVVWQDRSADPSAFLVTPPMVEIIGVRT